MTTFFPSVNDPMRICDIWFRVERAKNYFALLSRKVWVIVLVFMFLVWRSTVMLFLTLIKDTALPPSHVCMIVGVCQHLPVCLTDRRTASCSLRTFCSLPPRLSGVSPNLNSAALLYWIPATLAHVFSMEYCHQSCAAAETWGLAVNLCVFVCMCSCEPMKWQVWAMCVCVCESDCEHACTSMSFSALKWAGPFKVLLQEQTSAFHQAFVCMRVLEVDVALSFDYRGRKHRGAVSFRCGLLASQGKRLWHLKCSSLPVLLFSIWLAILPISFSQHTSPFFHV